MEARIVVEHFKVLIPFLSILFMLLEINNAARAGFYSYGILTSRNYPAEYPCDLEEYWSIRVPEEHIARITFEDFEVEKCEGINCTCDSLSVYDGNSENDPLLGKFCGSDILPITFPKSKRLFLVFKTDESVVNKGFRASVTVEYNPRAFITSESERRMTNYFLKTKRQESLSINQWGTDITRSAVALFLYDSQFFKAGNETGEKIAYELTLQLMSKLVTKKQISTKDLALFVNAMTVACIDPKNFFGLNLVSELRKRVDNSNDTNPFFLLALCIGGEDMKRQDVLNLQLLFDLKLRPSWTDTRAMVLMALKCIQSKHHTLLNETINMMLELKRKQQINGSIDNLKTTALVVQAIIAHSTLSYKTDFNMSLALKSIEKDLRLVQDDVEEMYYILPIISWKSLLHINSNHCANVIRTDLEGIKNTHKDPDERIQIQISIIIGDAEDFSRTWKIKVPRGFSFYQALENISYSEQDYKIQFTVLEAKPYVSAVGNFKNSVEDGSFWFLYTTQLSSADDLVLVESSPVDIEIDEKTQIILWYRSEPRSTEDAFSFTTLTEKDIFYATEDNKLENETEKDI